VSGIYGAPSGGPPAATGRGTLLVAVGLLVLAAALSVAGSFGAFMVQRMTSIGGAEPAVFTSTGWRYDITGVEPPVGGSQQAPLYGLPLVLAGIVAVLAAALLLARPGLGRALAVLAGGVLVGSVASLWLNLLSTVAVLGRVPAVWESVELGAGAWLVLLAGMLALVAAGLVLALPAVDHETGSPHPVHPPPAGGPHGPFPPAPPQMPGRTA
jgi:hypothetical protein